MKKLLLLLAIATIFASCDKKQVATLTTSNDSLNREVAIKDSIINSAFTDMDQIASSLNQITEREKLVNEQSVGDITKSKKDQIADNIVAISELLDKNREALARLNATTKKLNAANVEMSGLKKLVASLQKQIAEKDQQIADLTAKLEARDGEIKTLIASVTDLNQTKSNLETKVTEQSSKIDDQTAKINTVEYIVSSEKDLIERNIIDKKGFIGRTKTVGSNLDGLVKADLRQLDRIKISQKKIQIVTSHPEGSYMIVTNDKKVVEEIVITNKEQFWKNSKILIVSYK